MTERGGSRQAFVDRVFRDCMARDERFRDDIVRAVKDALRDEIRACKAEGDPMPFPGWQPDSYDLQVAISRTASRRDGDGRREFYPAYDDPRRYVSVERVRALVAKVDDGTIGAEETGMLLSMLGDLRKIEEHWARELGKVRVEWTCVQDLVVEAETARLDLGDAVQGELLGDV